MNLITTAPTSAASMTSSAQRMAWLDALRGLAAIVVALFHLSPHVIGRELHLQIYNYIDLGKYGVLLFFLVSGYVIPMSLERHGSLRKFWIGRLFRIYPTYLFAIIMILVMAMIGVMKRNRDLHAETVTAVLGQITMLQDFIGLRGMITPFWTLSFEMTFYLIVAGLFAWGLHQLSAVWATGLSLVAVFGGTLLPNGLLGSTFNHRRALAILVLTVIAGSLYAYISGRRLPVLAAGAAGICLILLPAVNGHATAPVVAAASWQAILMMAVMFAGTVIYRLQHGQIAGQGGIAALTVVFLSCVFTNWLHTGLHTELVRWTSVSLAVAVTFGIGFALRHRNMPPVLAWLGAISFSVYLLHVVVLNLVLYLIPKDVYRSSVGWAVVLVGFTVGTVALSWFAYHFVEQPGQALGRRLQRRAQTYLDPEEPLRPVQHRVSGSDLGSTHVGVR